jgi:cell wall-associated NlpC family hydrolase
MGGRTCATGHCCHVHDTERLRVMRPLRRRRGAAALLATMALFAPIVAGQAADADTRTRAQVAALLDQQNLRLGSYQIEQQALIGGALRRPVASSKPAIVIFLSVQAMLHRARALSPRRQRTDMRQIMGRVPFNLSHRIARRPYHRAVYATHTLNRFHGRAHVGTSTGLGMRTVFRRSRPAPFQHADGIYVDPTIPQPTRPTVAAVALRFALKKLGHPYVWAAAGPDTFDCSGLVRWAYGRAGVVLTHYTGSQWNESRLIPARAALPGDLILVGGSLHHVGMYLGAGWMLNAPFTGHYVDVVPVPRHIAGVVRP